MEDDVTYPERLFLFISTFAIFSTLFHPSAAANAAKDDAAILQKLSFSLKPAPKEWVGDPCNWRGVHCDSSGHVDYLDFRKFGLSGQLPPELAKLSRLKSIFLQGNSFSGPFPPFSDLPYLEQVFLNGNQFNSVPPGFLKGLTGLKTLNIQDNPISPPWNFPDSLADSTSLTILDADNCSLFGTLPDIFGSLSNLQDIRLSYNNLTGPLPLSLAKTGIQNLWLNNQDMGFSGRIDVLGQMPHLAQVWLHKNQFTGPIPDLSKAVSLFDLSLRDNELTGPVPPSLSDLPKLLNISLQKNMLQGPLPSFRSEVKVDLGDVSRFCNPCDPQVITLLEIAGGIGYPLVLAQSWVGNNPCKGWMSVTCNNQGSVTELNLAKRDFVGRISPSFANLSSLTKIDLSNNSLTGIIPPDLTRLSNLELLDISYNNISGKLPNFRSNVVVKRDGNPFFGRDIPLDGESSGGSSLGKKGKVWLIVICILVVLIVLAVAAFVLYKRYLKKRKGKNNWFKDPEKSNKKTPRKGPETSPKAFTGYTSDKPSVSSGEHSDLHGYENGSIIIPIEVLREVTDNFSEYNILGQGGFGVVYRGQLPDGTQIAVKRMEVGMASSKGLSEFEAEIAVLSKVRHRHLVALHGFCVNGNERLLVYEYMPQGTLGQHLFSYRELGIPPLTWKQRVTVLLDVARGVEYLHSLAQQSFIHRDLKPSNVLLDDDLRAKVSDFGLVRNAPDGKHSLETRLAGTFGYLAPEYAATGKVTTKVDVFAFGVILMEAMTGRKALDENLPDEQCHLVSWFRRVIVQNNLADLRQSLDPVLETDEETFASICKAAELAGHCTAREPHQRPDMGHAVSVLSPLVQQWKPSAKSDEDSFAIDLDMSLPQALQKWQSSEGNTSTTMSSTFNPSDYSTSKGNSFNWRNGK